MFIRQRKNNSGSISVQIIDKSSGKYKVVETIGCAKNDIELEFYLQSANQRLEELNPNLFNYNKQHQFISINNDQISIIGPEIIFGKILDYIGCQKIFNKHKNMQLFKDLVITRLIHPGSKLNLTNYLLKYTHQEIDIQTIYRFLDNIHYNFKDDIEQCIFDYTKSVVGEISVSFYDVTTLYFEASSEDDLRKVGFSKDGQFTKPQIVLGLLTSLEGYPLGFEIHQGNTYEGNTFIPILLKFQKKFNIKKPIVVADSGLLSKKNIEQLEANNYTYILGARIKSVSQDIKDKIVNLELNEDKNIDTILLSNTQKLIVSYSQKRAKKDKYTREKNLQKLEQKVKSRNLTKSHLNNKGYNKYLELSTTCNTQISINYDKYNYDTQFDGLKGFITNNFTLNPTQIIEHYINLWHILISFIAYTVYKEFERKLKINNIDISVKSAIDDIKTMYGFINNNKMTIFSLNDQQ